MNPRPMPRRPATKTQAAPAPPGRPPPMRRLVALAATLLPCAVSTAAQPVDAVVISTSGAAQRLFDTPHAIGVVSADELRAAGPMVNLSEALARVPGLVVNNRQNHAQDIQISSRGFGARASFGVRGLRLVADGIPASGPDGQGQVAHFDLAGAARIEVLRGPFSALYGNSSGGAIALVSTAPTERRAELGIDAGSDGMQQWRFGVEAPFDGGFSLRAQVSQFQTDGLRPHSRAERQLGNLRLGWEGSADRVVVVLNTIDQPALDPLGLTRVQFEADPDQTTGIALPQERPGQGFRYNTRKETRQDQAGASWRHRFDGTGALRELQFAAYAGQRAVTQWQAIPDTVQLAAPTTHPGGVIDFDRRYHGADLRLVWRWALDDSRQARLVAGASLDQSDEDRRGWRNFSGDGADRLLGVTGELRRNERNRVGARDIYAQAEIDLSQRWTATLGLRSGRVAFRSADRFLANGDDSGALDYRYTNPVAALQWRATPELNIHLGAGRGFESPTFNELAYRPSTPTEPSPTGFNTALKAQTSRQVEVGAKWRPATLALALDVALFEARGEDEIGVASNSGGRTTFRNVGRTLRRGAEVDARWSVAPAWQARLAATWLDASYRDGAAAGRRIAGTLSGHGYAELAWQAAAALEMALELRAQGRLPVNDANADFAAGHGLLALRARWQVALGSGRLELLGRVDNLADLRVVGSVIVNEANGRFFEPAPGRAWGLSARWQQPF